jgi:hypothetical protein
VKTFEVGLKRAVLGLPFYVTWNLVAYVNERQGLVDKAKAMLAAIVLVPLSLALWAAPWLAVLWFVSWLGELQ